MRGRFRDAALAAAAALLLPASFAFGQAHTPKAGSTERKAILAALRPQVEKDVRQKVVFRIEHLKALGDWAFAYGFPEQPSGRRLDLSHTRYAPRIADGVFDNNFSALFRRKKGRWTVVTWVIGSTDVPWIPWPEKYRAPKAIFPSAGR